MPLPGLAQELLAAAQAAHPASLSLVNFLATLPPGEGLAVRGMAVGLAVEHLVRLKLLDLDPASHLSVVLTKAGLDYRESTEA